MVVTQAPPFQVPPFQAPPSQAPPSQVATAQPQTNQTTVPSADLVGVRQEATALRTRPEETRIQSNGRKTVRFADGNRDSSPLFFPIEDNDRAPAKAKLPDKASHETFPAKELAPAKLPLSRSMTGFPDFKFNGLKIRQRRVLKTNEKHIGSLASPEPSKLIDCSTPAGKGKGNIANKDGLSAKLLAPAVPSQDMEIVEEVPSDIPINPLSMVNDGRCTINFNINLSGLASKDFKLSSESRDLVMARDCLSIASKALKDKSRDKSRKDQIVRKRNHDLNSDLLVQREQSTKLSSELKSCRQELSLQADEVTTLKRSLEASRLKTTALKEKLNEERKRSAEAKTTAAAKIANLENVIRDLQANLEGLKSSQLNAKLVDPWIRESQQAAAPLSPVSDPKPSSDHSLQRSIEEGPKSPNCPSERSPSAPPRPEHHRCSLSPSPPAQRRRGWHKRDFAVVVPKTQKTAPKRATRSNSRNENHVYLYESSSEVDDTRSSTSSDTEDSLDEDDGFDEIIEEDAQISARLKPKNNEEAQQLFDDLFGVPKNLKACLDGTRLAFKDGTLVSLPFLPHFSTVYFLSYLGSFAHSSTLLLTSFATIGCTWTDPEESAQVSCW